MSLSHQTIKVIKATAPVVAEHATAITTNFYPTLFKNNPEALHFFNKTNQSKGMQNKALADSIVAYASNIDNLGAIGGVVEKIAHRHVALNVTPELYPIVHDNLMIAIGDTLGDAITPEIGEAWSDAVMFLAGVCIDAEERIAQQAASRQGGWRGEREFELVRKVEQAAGTMSFDLAPTDGYSGGFEYSSGQYLTIRINGKTPRHYTLTSASGDTTLQCTTRLLDGGDVSSYMHGEMAIGERCLLGPPVGIFTPQHSDSDAVLISAGIGVTPMFSFLGSIGPRVKHAMHVDQSPERHAFRTEFEQAGVDCKFIYTDESGMPDLSKEAERLCETVGPEAEYYVCGPPSFMSTMEEELQKRGASNVFSEKFGTGN